MLRRAWAGGTPRPSAQLRATSDRRERVLRAGALGRGGRSGASPVAHRFSGGRVDAVPLPCPVARQAALTPARKVQMISSPALSNAHVQLQGAFPPKFVILILNYLMLGHNPTIGRPCLLQHVVREPRFG